MWAHGEWSLGYTASRPDGGEWHEDPCIGLGVDDVGMEQRAGAAAPLDLSDALNSHSAPFRGLKGITGYGRNMVKSAGYLLKEKYPHHRVTLGTVTLPPMPRHHRRIVSVAWPEVTRQMIQYLSRQLKKAGVPPLVVSVTEIQPSRLAQTGEAYLHLHLLWLNRPAKKGQWSISPNQLRNWFSSLLSRVLQTEDVGHVNVDVKAVNGNVAAYLAKYMSKGGDCLEKAMDDLGPLGLPSTWWNMTASMRKAVKTHTHKGAGAGMLLEQILGYSWSTGDFSLHEYLRHIEVELDGLTVTVGFRGRFREDVAVEIRRMLESANIGRLEGDP